MFHVRASLSLFGLQALRRKPDYPKVLERRARLIDRQVDQENTKKNSQTNAQEANHEPEEAKQRNQHDQPHPQDRAAAQGSTRRGCESPEEMLREHQAESRRQAEDGERGEAFRESLAQAERMEMLVQEQERQAEDERCRKQYEARIAVLMARLTASEVLREAEDEEERSEVSGESREEDDHWREDEQEGAANASR